MTITEQARGHLNGIYERLITRHKTAVPGSTVKFMAQIIVNLGDTAEASTVESIRPLVAARDGRFVECIIGGYGPLSVPIVDVESSPSQDCGEHYNNL